MGQLFQLIIDNLYKLWPVRIVDADEQGLRFRFGKHTDLLSPGTHWFVPGLMKIEKFCVTYQEIDCEVQTMDTADNMCVSFSANAGYIIRDVVKYRLGLHSADSTIERRLRGILGDLVEDSLYADLRKSRRKFADRAKKDLIKQCETWGVEVVNVSLTDFAKTKAYRLFGMTQFN
jgi:regulator of protease activity HflC (stomatin/prohibitin superfamily)